MMTTGRVSTGMLPTGPVYQPTMTPYNAPNTGLVGREQALRGGFDAATAALNQGIGGVGGNVNANYRHINQNRDMAINQANSGIRAMMPVVNQGQQAGDMQAALSGALGPQAQAQAFANYQSSPGQQYLRDEAEQALIRQAAATGGLRGGNVLQALQQNAIGLAAQDYQNQFNRLGTMADRGLQGLGYQANLYGQASNAASAAGGQGAGVQGAAIGANASLGAAGIGARAALARDAGNYAFQTGSLMAQGRTDAGSALAGLYNQQGSGMADIYGQGYGNIANILAAGGENQYNSDAARAALLSNINMGGASTVSGLPTAPYTTQNMGLGRNIGESRNAMHQATKTGGEAMNEWGSFIGGFGV